MNKKAYLFNFSLRKELFPQANDDIYYPYCTTDALYLKGSAPLVIIKVTNE